LYKTASAAAWMVNIVLRNKKPKSASVFYGR
jgi:hypothetical protein